MSDNQPASEQIESQGAALEANALRRRIAELEESVVARDAFIAIVAHELRNPMTPILATMQRLRRNAYASDGLSAEVGARLEQLERLIQRYVRRATTLLDVLRINAANVEMKRDEVDFSALVRGVVEAAQPVAQHMRTTVLLDVPAEIRGCCDRLAFEQIAENLVSNALRYGDEKPVHVGLVQRGDMVELSVADGGTGMSEADQARIFEHFERVISHACTSPGFGVGLFIVRQLVRAMSGRIQVRSASGRGSTFTVVLPLRATGPTVSREDLH